MPPLTPLDIQHKEFTKAMRGYAMHEVDTFLDQVTEEFTRMQDEIARLREQASSTAPAQPAPVVQQAPPPPPPQPQPVAAESRGGAVLQHAGGLVLQHALGGLGELSGGKRFVRGNAAGEIDGLDDRVHGTGVLYCR